MLNLALGVWTGLLRSLAGLLTFIGLQWVIQFGSAIAVFVSVRKSEWHGSDGQPWVRVSAAILLTVALLGGQSLVLRNLTLRAYKIPTSSMWPTIARGDRLIADMSRYLHSTPRRGEVVIFLHPSRDLLIKRVIALGGDTVEGKAGKVYVNGTATDEPYIPQASEPPSGIDDFGPL